MSNLSKKAPHLIIHILVWATFFITNASHFYFKFGVIPNDFLIRYFVLIIAFYLNFSLFVPKLLLNKKIYLYCAVIVSFSFFFIFVSKEVIPKPTNFLNDLINRGGPANFDPNVVPIRNEKPILGLFTFRGIFPSGGLVLLIFALSASVRLVFEWYNTEKQRMLIESQKVNSELSFLKAQLNPHFLFNSLNSIYSLAHKQSKETTDAIIILSDIMRYMIYEANRDSVKLEDEISNIQNYVSLQLLRLKDSSGVKVNIHGNLDHKIEPLLLISFIENAFKFGTDFTGKTSVNIVVTVKDQLLNLFVRNSVSIHKSNNENSGVGLENIKNRLNLLYPDKHQLNIKEDKDSYEVNLTLKLKE